MKPRGSRDKGLRFGHLPAKSSYLSGGFVVLISTKVQQPTSEREREREGQNMLAYQPVKPNKPRNPKPGTLNPKP